MNYKDDILNIRKERKVSVAQLSKITEIPVDRIYKWESGTGNPKSEDAKKLQEWLNKPDKVQERTPPPKEQKDMIQVLADLAAANREIAESNKQLSKNQEVLLSKISTTEQPPPKTFADETARMGIFLELLSEVLKGKHLTGEEAIIRLGRLTPSEESKVRKRDTRIS